MAEWQVGASWEGPQPVPLTLALKLQAAAEARPPFQAPAVQTSDVLTLGAGFAVQGPRGPGASGSQLSLL